MKTTSFIKFIDSISSLDTRQYRLLNEQITNRNSRKIVSRKLETPRDLINCPHCKSSTINRWGTRNDMQRYKCKNCRKTFNSFTGTPLARLKRKGHWIHYADCMKQGISLRKAAKKCGIHKNTALKWRHRFLQNTNDIKSNLLKGIIEVNESYFYETKQGIIVNDKKLRNHKYLRNSVKRICILIGRDRNDNTLDGIIEKFNSFNISKLLSNHISKDSLFCSSSSRIYRKFTKENQLRHGRLMISEGEEVKKDIVHLKYVIAYQNNLHSWIINHFRCIASKNLKNYLSWFRMLDEFEELSSWTFLLRAKSGGKYKDQPQTVT